MLALGLASAIIFAGSDHTTRIQEALGNLAYTIGACEQALPHQSADKLVLTLTGADIKDPSDEQRQYRSLFTALFIKGRSNTVAGELSSVDCSEMIEDMTKTLHAVADEKTTL